MTTNVATKPILKSKAKNTFFNRKILGSGKCVDKCRYYSGKL